MILAFGSSTKNPRAMSPIHRAAARVFPARAVGFGHATFSLAIWRRFFPVRRRRLVTPKFEKGVLDHSPSHGNPLFLRGKPERTVVGHQKEKQLASHTVQIRKTMKFRSLWESSFRVFAQGHRSMFDMSIPSSLPNCAAIAEFHGKFGVCNPREKETY